MKTKTKANGNSGFLLGMLPNNVPTDVHDLSVRNNGNVLGRGVAVIGASTCAQSTYDIAYAVGYQLSQHQIPSNLWGIGWGDGRSL